MKIKYEITIRHRKVLGACLIIERDTKEEAVQFMTEDTASCGEFYSYEVMRCVLVEGDGWHRVEATYYMNGVELTEADYLKHIKVLVKSGLKS
jgi:hypothetical protein